MKQDKVVSQPTNQPTNHQSFFVWQVPFLILSLHIFLYYFYTQAVKFLIKRASTFQSKFIPSFTNQVHRNCEIIWNFVNQIILYEKKCLGPVNVAFFSYCVLFRIVIVYLYKIRMNWLGFLRMKHRLHHYQWKHHQYFNGLL